MNLNALLRIGTKVTGSEQVVALRQKFDGLQGAAKSLTGQSGFLASSLRTLAPVATIGGIGALVEKTIAAGDAMHDMAQRTGVSVESLAKFKKAATTTGTDLDSVAKSLAKLSKGLYEAGTTGKGTAAEALKTLGISAKDATGALKSADQITLEIADKFKAMPDGVTKTALAMQLFGKSGAEMIPLLNMGGQAIDKLKVRMTSAFAEKADQYSDKMATLSSKVGGLAADITIALLPALDLMVTGITSVVDAFNNLPGPIKTIVGLGIGLATIATAVGGLLIPLQALASLGLGAAVMSWVGAIGGFIGTVATAVAAVVGWPVVVGAALIALGVLIYSFRDQIGQVLQAIGSAIATTAGTIYSGVVGFLGSIGSAITGALGAIAGQIRSGIGAVWAWIGSQFSALSALVTAVPSKVTAAVAAIGAGIRSGIGSAWGWLKKQFDTLTGWILGLVDKGRKTLSGLGDAITAPFRAAISAVRGSLNTILGSIAGAFNMVIGNINNVISGVNRAASALRLPQLPYLPRVPVPSFEGGGFTGDGPRSGGLDGRGGFMAMLHPNETIIDHTRASGPAMAPPQINLTGPVMMMPDGSQWVSRGELDAALSAYGQAIFRQLASPSGRVARGGSR
jgi:uncharacterized protein YidB (DUF937 family)